MATYFWDGRLQDEAEILLIIKTTAARLAELDARLKILHPYELPELVATRRPAGTNSTWNGSEAAWRTKRSGLEQRDHNQRQNSRLLSSLPLEEG